MIEASCLKSMNERSNTVTLKQARGFVEEEEIRVRHRGKKKTFRCLGVGGTEHNT